MRAERLFIIQLAKFQLVRLYCCSVWVRGVMSFVSTSSQGTLLSLLWSRLETVDRGTR